ncbi:MAG: hypothetical protein NTX52_01765 [Planctomycetota bacterium]|nr:hypothetical protein [Planctomycetota bacterium]
MKRSCMVQSDAEIVSAVLNGYKEAFAMLVKRYERPVRAIALDVLGDYHSTADVSQDAFVKAYRELPCLQLFNAPIGHICYCADLGLNILYLRLSPGPCLRAFFSRRH